MLMPISSATGAMIGTMMKQIYEIDEETQNQY